MQKKAAQYLVEALFIIRENIYYVFIPVLIYTGQHFSVLVNENLKTLATLLFVLILFISLPLFYGQFIEIIYYGKKESWSNIFNKYWLKFVLVILFLVAPIVIFDLIFSKMRFFNFILIVLLKIVLIYILPLVLIKKEIINSIQLGVQCLLGNIKFSIPLILAVLSSFIFSFFYGYMISNIESQFISFVFLVIIAFLLTILNYLVFIAASLILKEKLFVS